MSLEDELEAQRQRAYAQRSPAERKVRAAAVTAVANARTAERALGEGEPIPRFQLPSIEGGLADAGLLLEYGPLVISFYRGGWCPYCNIELRSLQRRLPDIEALGASLVAISPEMPDRTLITVQSDALTFPVLFDKGNEVARQFRLTHQIDPQVVRYQLGNGNDVAAYNGMDTAEVPLPATYVVGTERGRPLRLRGRRLHAASRSRGPHRRAPRPRSRARRDVRHRVRTGQRDRRGNGCHVERADHGRGARGHQPCQRHPGRGDPVRRDPARARPRPGSPAPARGTAGRRRLPAQVRRHQRRGTARVHPAVRCPRPDHGGGHGSCRRRRRRAGDQCPRAVLPGGRALGAQRGEHLARHR